MYEKVEGTILLAQIIAIIANSCCGDQLPHCTAAIPNSCHIAVDQQPIGSCLLQQKLGVILEKEDEMECLVGGCNFLLKAIRHEAFTYENGALNFVSNTGRQIQAPCMLQL